MQYPLALLRIIIGWHLLYEGWAKLTSPGWSSAGYLRFSTGPFAEFYHWIGGNESLVRISDQLNILGLIGIGLALMLGVLIRPAALAGVGLLALYYFAYPPLFGPVSGTSEGENLIVNKNVIELFALAAVVAFPTKNLGIGALLRRLPARRIPAAPQGMVGRRELVVGLAGLPVLGAFVLAVLKKHGWKSFEEVQLRRSNPRDVAIASPTLKSFRFSSINDLKGPMPAAKIGNVTLSRMILGGNLIGGWAHARDLIYVSKLVKAYHTRNKVFETFDLAESCGVNAILTNPALCEVINQYWRVGGKIQFISDCGGKDLLTLVKKSIDRGACACYVQGGIADELVAKGQYDQIAQALDLIRRN
jgi:uncharacterized membrane protein YphA (DoxX/SURF4 family)